MDEKITTAEAPEVFTLGAPGKCGRCKWSDVAKGQDGKIDFNMRTCKFEPPKLFIVPGPAPGQINVQCMWPMVGAQDKGCSKFAAMMNS